MPSFVGIDLGTTFSAIAVLDESGSPRIVHNKDGKNITPSCVAEQDGIVEVGELAQKTWGESPELAAARFKRSMGTSQTFSMNGKEYSPTELSALVLKKLVKDAESQIGHVTEAVITIPANFAHEAREATMAAARLAGLSVKHIINEPTAAALFYAFKNNTELNGVYAVYDLGGGTFDISIIKAEGKNIEVLSSNGVSKLGGDDFDTALIGIAAKKYKEATGKALDISAFTKNDAEDVKKALSSRAKTKVKVGDASFEISRTEFEEAISSLVTQAEMLCESTLDDAKVQSRQIKGVFLVGGSTRVPAIRESVKRIFHQDPQSTINVDEVVALGAAVYAAYKAGATQLNVAQNAEIKNVRVEERTSKCFGTFILGFDESREDSKLKNTVIIPKGERIPCGVTKSFYTIADGQENVNCVVTESGSAETDPRFVKVIWEGTLKLPPGRPKDQEIKVVFSYDENQIMKCKFIDVGTGRESNIDLSMSSASSADESRINKFLVE